MLHRPLALLVSVFVFMAIVAWNPRPTAIPSSTPDDPRKEDLSRVEYPSTRGIRWEPYFMQPQDRLEDMFGSDWVHVARFNRIDRHHAYPGMTIKKPRNVADLRSYNPLPMFYEPARSHPKYVLISVTEQWLGAYEYGRLRISVPAATGTPSHPTPQGLFRIDAHDRHHTSSLYKVKDRDIQYPMDYALRFHIDSEDGTSYWIHARDLPGKPASHGCVGLLCEPMQKRTYGAPDKPAMDDAVLLYRWVVDEEEEIDGDHIIENGPIVEITGGFPVFASR